MDDVEDNVGDSTLRKMWVAGHAIVESTIDKIDKNVEELRQYVVERRKKERIDGWKFIRDVAASIAGNIDKFTK